MREGEWREQGEDSSEIISSEQKERKIKKRCKHIPGTKCSQVMENWM